LEIYRGGSPKSFQTLENILPDFSKHWKNKDQKFQTLEEDSPRNTPRGKDGARKSPKYAEGNRLPANDKIYE